MTAFSILGILGIWEKKVFTFCDDYYVRYQNFKEAKEACIKDSNCAAIYDDFCNNNRFFLCQKNYTEIGSAHSCLYIKPAGTANIKILVMNITHYDFSGMKL